jgi:hypothetical protein
MCAAAIGPILSIDGQDGSRSHAALKNPGVPGALRDLKRESPNWARGTWPKSPPFYLRKVFKRADVLPELAVSLAFMRDAGVLLR